MAPQHVVCQAKRSMQLSLACQLVPQCKCVLFRVLTHPFMRYRRGRALTAPKRRGSSAMAPHGPHGHGASSLQLVAAAICGNNLQAPPLRPARPRPLGDHAHKHSRTRKRVARSLICVYARTRTRYRQQSPACTSYTRAHTQIGQGVGWCKYYMAVAGRLPPAHDPQVVPGRWQHGASIADAVDAAVCCL